MFNKCSREVNQVCGRKTNNGLEFQAPTCSAIFQPDSSAPISKAKAVLGRWVNPKIKANSTIPNLSSRFVIPIRANVF